MTKALLLAAGKSTRIASEAGSLPKPLIEVDGVPILVHNLRLLAAHGVREVWINVHYEAERIQQAVGDGRQWGIVVNYSMEKEILGTAGAVKNLSSALESEPFLVLYGDNYTNCNLTGLLAAHRRNNSVATIVLLDFMKSVNSGIAGGRVAVDTKGNILRFSEGESTRQEIPKLVNAGIYAFEPDILKFIPKEFSDFGKDVFPSLLKDRIKLSTYIMDGFCLAVDTPEALAKTREVLSKKGP